MDSFPPLAPALPELILVAAACAALMAGVFRRGGGEGPATALVLAGMFAALAAVLVLRHLHPVRHGEGRRAP